MNPLLASVIKFFLKFSVVGLVVMLVVMGIYQFGRHVEAGEVAQDQLKAARDQADRAEELRDKADLLAVANSQLRAQAEARQRVITKEVIRYVDVTPAAARCSLPGTWRLRHDAAATGLPITAESGSLADGANASVDDAAALETIAENYATARECFDKLAGWQRRYRELEQ